MAKFETLPKFPERKTLDISVHLTPALNEQLDAVLHDFVSQNIAGIPRRYDRWGRDCTAWYIKRYLRVGMNKSPGDGYVHDKIIFGTTEELTRLVAVIKNFRELEDGSAKSNCTRLVKKIETAIDKRYDNAVRRYEEKLREIKAAAEREIGLPEFVLKYVPFSGQRFELRALSVTEQYGFQKTYATASIHVVAQVDDGEPVVKYFVTRTSYSSTSDAEKFDTLDAAKEAALAIIIGTMTEQAQIAADETEQAKALMAMIAA